MAAGPTSTTQRLGGAVGPAVLVAVAGPAASVAGLRTARLAAAVGTVAGLRTARLAAAVGTVVTALVALRFTRPAAPPPAAPGAAPRTARVPG
ncbi:hypothetical protein [Streptomyces pilosus]|uniref:Uncharacterized protein n=1 Tax=Streptomyces pilosus TaxID=28893 RepID=A0A918EUN1_9ACTN|nr:hypothetical protein [Streptomyces pilosus]GGQ74283.1 hypothetical protein GCM10010280_20930 [Streptomyces pilosus]GGV60859.1 hypothetical protein GCM10010261_49250 [Streptomyces pilosus]